MGFEPTTGVRPYAASNGVSVAGRLLQCFACPRRDSNAHVTSISGWRLSQLGHEGGLQKQLRAIGQTRTDHLGRTRTVLFLMSYDGGNTTKKPPEPRMRVGGVSTFRCAYVRHPVRVCTTDE